MPLVWMDATRRTDLHSTTYKISIRSGPSWREMAYRVTVDAHRGDNINIVSETWGSLSRATACVVKGERVCKVAAAATAVHHMQLWNTRVLGVRIKQARCTCFAIQNESESCYASESVLVVGELLCTGVQADTERHTRKETREMCSCWGYKQHSSSRKSEEWRDSNFQQSSRLANLGS